MVEKINSDNVKKKDLELILEVNKNAIEIQTEVADQFEDIISSLTEIKKEQADQTKKIDKITDQAEATNKDLFKIQILFVTGLLSIIVQIVQVFVKK